METHTHTHTHTHKCKPITAPSTSEWPPQATQKPVGQTPQHENFRSLLLGPGQIWVQVVLLDSQKNKGRSMRLSCPFAVGTPLPEVTCGRGLLTSVKEGQLPF